MPPRPSSPRSSKSPIHSPLAGAAATSSSLASSAREAASTSPAATGAPRSRGRSAASSAQASKAAIRALDRLEDGLEEERPALGVDGARALGAVADLVVPVADGGIEEVERREAPPCVRPPREPRGEGEESGGGRPVLAASEALARAGE